MTAWAIYEVSGKIDRIYQGEADDAAFQPMENEFVVVCPSDLDDSTAYVSSGQVVEKQPLSLPESLQITADGIDEAVITSIPAGVTVEWPDGQTDEVTDGEVRFSVDLPGTYTLTFDAIPYLRQEVTIEAVAAA